MHGKNLYVCKPLYVSQTPKLERTQNLETQNAVISKEEIKRLLDVEKLKYCYECGICTASCSMTEMLGKDYNPRTLLEKIFLNPESVLAS